MNRCCLILAALIAAAALAAGCGHPAPGPRPPATRTASASTAAAPVAAPAMSSWCAGPGNASLRAVRADLSQVQSDAAAGSLAAAEADGSQLTADAEAAEKLPPPVTLAQKVIYVEAMGALSFAGTDLGAGNTAAAQAALDAASRYLDRDKGIISC